MYKTAFLLVEKGIDRLVRVRFLFPSWRSSGGTAVHTILANLSCLAFLSLLSFLYLSCQDDTHLAASQASYYITPDSVDAARLAVTRLLNV